ncbi:hypothetical protein M1567_02535 [Candidatus Marsarchaeota archaeon]|nr:hypothetical protein [Candidatus Marsarchaeota archaeon]
MLGKRIDEKLDGELRKYPEIYSGYWSKYAVTIPKRIAEISGLEWKEASVTCYLVGKHRSFSDPLSIRTYQKEDPFVATLVHELIHRLLYQNREQLAVFWSSLKQRHPDAKPLALRHIPVFAIQKALYIDIFGENSPEFKMIKPPETSIESDYPLAWEIMEEEGHDTIIKMIKNGKSEQA